MAEKAPYKLVVKLDSARPDVLGDALRQLREIAGDYDQTGEAVATITIESDREAPLSGIADDFEVWLYKHAIGIGCEVRMARPGLRPEMVSVLRARYATPMDDAGWERAEHGETDGAGDVLITPPPVVPLALPAPGALPMLTVDGEYTIEE